MEENEREDEDVPFMGVDINSLAYWSKESNKAARLQYVFQEYGVDSAGLHKVCVNWAKVPQSKSLANSLQDTAGNIRSVASHNKSEGEAKGMGHTQRVGDHAGAQRGVDTIRCRFGAGTLVVVPIRGQRRDQNENSVGVRPNGQLGQQRGDLLEVATEIHREERAEDKPQGNVPQTPA